MSTTGRTTYTNSTGHTLRVIPTGDIMVHVDPEGPALGYVAAVTTVVPTDGGEVLAAIVDGPVAGAAVRLPRELGDQVARFQPPAPGRALGAF